ncbi:MAG TPA: hypothetical protein VKA02_11120 [Candidatus Acidoferrum sp.]|nr:hypothetical protein [Candidatus Acidoferrum sp.]
MRNKLPSIDAPHASSASARLFPPLSCFFLVAELGIPIDDHIAFCIQALREHADALDLRGSL